MIILWFAKFVLSVICFILSCYLFPPYFVILKESLYPPGVHQGAWQLCFDGLNHICYGMEYDDFLLKMARLCIVVNPIILFICMYLMIREFYKRYRNVCLHVFWMLYLITILAGMILLTTRIKSKHMKFGYGGRCGWTAVSLAIINVVLVVLDHIFYTSKKDGYKVDI